MRKTILQAVADFQKPHTMTKAEAKAFQKRNPPKIKPKSCPAKS
jgi:hypothetical protein